MAAGAAVSWISKRQATVALSTAEAEYATACLAAQEVQWIRQLLAEINAPVSKEPPRHVDALLVKNYHEFFSENLGIDSTPDVYM